MKKIKKLLCMLLCCCMLLGTIAGCGSTSESESETDPVTLTEQTEVPAITEMKEPDAELKRAINAGMMPEAWCAQLDNPITFKQYTSVLTRIVELWNADKLSEWQNITSLAVNSDEPMRHQDGILMLSYLWILMGKGTDHVYGYLDENLHDDHVYSDDFMLSQTRDITWDYQYFPDWETDVYDIYGANYMWGGVMTFSSVMSPVSGEFVLSPNDNGSFCLNESLTFEDAVRMAVRVAEYCKVEFDEDWRAYIAVSDVGSYNKEIIADALLNQTTDLPEVSQGKLPSEWKGAGISYRKDFVEEYLHFSEGDIVFLHENGFNFTRMFFNFQTLRYPDYPADPYVVNEKELEELDQMLAWCMEYGVHLQIAMSGYMDVNGNNLKEEPNGMPLDDETWALTQAYWTMLAKRYADIPSKYLSFDLCNETEPQPEEIPYQREKLAELVNAVRDADPDRVLLISQGSQGDTTWTEVCASLGIAVGCHPYLPAVTASADWTYRQQNPYAKAIWPLPYFPIANVSEGRGSVQLEGDIGGAEVSIHINRSGPNPVIGVYADGRLIEQLAPQGEPNDMGEYNYYDTIYTAQIPDDAATVSLKVESDYAYIDTILVKKGDVTTTIIPSDALALPDRSDPLPIIINGDGTYTNSENLMYDGERIYREAIEPYQKIAEKYGVGFMVNEFGMFGTKVYWDIDVVTAFHETYLELLEEKGIPWNYCELYNVFPKHLIVFYGEESQWANATEEDITYTLKDGSEVTIRVCKELLDVFHSYTLEK